jgi:hypothetical protein
MVAALSGLRFFATVRQRLDVRKQGFAMTALQGRAFRAKWMTVRVKKTL